MSLTVIKPGILDTIQDAGRYGYRGWGINPGGVMDREAFQIANSLLGNRASAAVLEMHYPAPKLRCNDGLVIAITGADFVPQVNGTSVPLFRPIVLAAGDMLSFSRPRNGRLSYMAIKGGIGAVDWMGSRSTHIKLGQGGYHGRALRKGDELFSGLCLAEKVPDNKLLDRLLPWYAAPDQFSPEEPILVLPGKEWGLLGPAAQDIFLGSSFIVQQYSDRMGFTLEGEALHISDNYSLVSAPVQYGTVQLLPKGQMVVLMADHQTTGGYPRIAQVIAAHRGLLAQRPAGASVRFRMTDIVTAERLWTERQAYLRQLQAGCLIKWTEIQHKN